MSDASTSVFSSNHYSVDPLKVNQVSLNLHIKNSSFFLEIGLILALFFLGYMG